MYMTETPINTACFDMGMNKRTAISHFAQISLHCTDLSRGLWLRCDSICTVHVSAEPSAAKHGAAIDRLYPVREAPGRHSLLKLNFLNKSKLWNSKINSF